MGLIFFMEGRENSCHKVKEEREKEKENQQRCKEAIKGVQ